MTAHIHAAARPVVLSPPALPSRNTEANPGECAAMHGQMVSETTACRGMRQGRRHDAIYFSRPEFHQSRTRTPNR